MSEGVRVGLLGAGRMATALARAWVRSGLASTLASDAKGMTLRFTAEREAAGSFRIVGRSTTFPTLVRTAIAPPKTFGATVALWLTAAATPAKAGAKK